LIRAAATDPSPAASRQTAGVGDPDGPETSVDPAAAVPARAPERVEDVYRRCRDLGMRLSRQRRMVLDLLWAEKSHLSARDIFERLNHQGRHIGHTSVYQNLEALQSAGVIECLDRASGRLYGYRADPHSHLICAESGDILDLDVLLPADLLQQIEQRTGFLIESYTLHLCGRRRS
jgi:Fur family ferric uptake transcriptional regulator